MASFYTFPDLGDISEPATIVDDSGIMIDWHLPGVVFPQRMVGKLALTTLLINNIMQQYVNTVTRNISPLAAEKLQEVIGDVAKGKNVCWRTEPRYFVTDSSPVFGRGTLDFSPGWFAQAHEVSFT